MITTVEARKAKSLLALGKKLVIYHRDVDGITSAALFLKHFPADSLSLDSPKLDPATIHFIQEKAPELLVLLDLAVDRDWEALKELEKTMKILIIDHHLFEKSLDSSKTVYINPRKQKRGLYVSASHVVYNLFSKIGVKGDAWISGIGIIGDYAMEGGREVLKGLGAVAKGGRSSKLGEAAVLIGAAISAAGEQGSSRALRILIKAGSLEELISEPKLQEWKNGVEKEIEEVTDSFEGKKELHPGGVALLEVESRFSISSAVSTLLAERNPDLIIITWHKSDEGTKLSLRIHSGRVDLNALVRKAVKGIGQGGGHEKAAGALVTDWELFKKRFLEQLKPKGKK